MTNEHLTATLGALERYAAVQSELLEETRRGVVAQADCQARMRQRIVSNAADSSAQKAEPSFRRLIIRHMSPFRPCDLSVAYLRFIVVLLLMPLAILLAEILAKAFSS